MKVLNNSYALDQKLANYGLGAKFCEQAYCLFL